MNTIKKMVLSSFFFLIMGTIWAGPFGLEMGMKLSDIEKLKNVTIKHEKENIYTITPPSTHSSFESYIIQIHPQYGLYFIKAVGKSINTSVYGTELKSEFDKVLSGIKSSYGNCKLLDFLRKGSIWDEPRDWMTALDKKERVLMAYWETKEGSNMPNDIVLIILDASTLSTTKGYMVLEYYSDKTDIIEKEESAQQNSVF